jgi:hypothetical protein
LERSFDNDTIGGFLNHKDVKSTYFLTEALEGNAWKIEEHRAYRNLTVNLKSVILNP